MAHAIWAVVNADGSFEHVWESPTFDPPAGYPYDHPFGGVELQPGQQIVRLEGDIDEIKREAAAKQISPAQEIFHHRRADLTAAQKMKPIVAKT